MGLFGQKPPAKPRFSEGRVGFAIGDIHGRADLLTRMFDVLEREPIGKSKPLAIFLGDYVDRGPDSAEVIELLLTGRPEGFERRFLKGNHEAAMLAFLADPVAGRGWLNHGGLETLAAYGVHPLPSRGAGPDDVKRASAALRAALPNSHVRFLETLEQFAVAGDYCFVHAGIDPQRKLHEQSERDLLWIRRKFLEDTRRLDFVVVHGHTPQSAPSADDRRVGLDTGAYFSGVLSAARFEGESVEFVQAR